MDLIEIYIKKKKLKFKGVYGPPRGGLTMAVMLSHRLGIPMLLDPPKKDDHVLIVDDIADTGKTLKKFENYNNCKIMTLWYHKQSVLVPDYWINQKYDKWIVFPWESDE